MTATTAYVITGRGARIKHIQYDGTVLCPRKNAAQPATGRFEKLAVCSACTQELATRRAEPTTDAPQAEDAPQPGTDVTLVYGHSEPQAHRAGCGHLRRTKKGASGDETLTFATCEDVIAHVYADMINSGESTLAECSGGVEFAPCLNDLPWAEDPQPAPQPAAADDDDEGEPITVHLSARVARYLARTLADKLPVIASELGAARKEVCGRGYTAYVTTTTTRASTLLELMRQMAQDMNAGKRKTTGMGFRAEAVEKGVKHIGDDLFLHQMAATSGAAE